jgi:hypothetical protein
MTDEIKYSPENMSRGILTYATADGMVAFGIFATDPETDERKDLIAGILLPPEAARSVAANITWASIKAEESKT